MIRLAIVGCGSHAELQHAVPLARYVRENPKAASLAAACDLVAERAERFCRQYGFERAYTDVDQMLREQAPDAVVSVVQPQATPELAAKLLNQGVVCSIEKPPGATRAEAEALAEVARRTGTPHMVSMNRRFAPFLNRAVEWAGAHGRVTHLRGVMLRNWRFEPDFIVGTGIHTVDAMRHLGGDAVLAAVDRRTVGGASWYTLRLEYASGALGQVEIFPTTGFNAERYELYGEGFAVVATVPTGTSAEEGTLRCWLDRKLVVDEAYSIDTPVDIANGAYDETKAWMSALRSGKGFCPTLEDVGESLAICFDCYERGPAPPRRGSSSAKGA